MEQDMTEKIGKVTLDYSFYQGTDEYSDGAIEDELLEIAKTVKPADFPLVIEEKKSWAVF